MPLRLWPVSDKLSGRMRWRSLNLRSLLCESEVAMKDEQASSKEKSKLAWAVVLAQARFLAYDHG